MTVPGVSPLVCAALPGQKDLVVPANAISIPSLVSFDLLTATVSCQNQNGCRKKAPEPNAAWQGFTRLLSWARSMHPRPAILLLLFGGMVSSLAAAELPGWVIEAPEGVDIDL